MKTITTFLVTAFTALLVTAQDFELVKDINPAGHAHPTELTELNGKLYFGANDGTHGNELWVSDGTAAGTQLLKDMASGPAGANPRYFTEYNGKLYFQATNDVDGTGREPWVTDGTEAGTHILKDINPGGSDGLASGSPNFTVFNDKLYFKANDGINNYQLWVSDGTAAGTQMLKIINPNNNAWGSSDIPEFTEYNGKLYFMADDGTNGRELWLTDGTTAGTVMLKDIHPTGSSQPFGFTKYNGKLYFQADDGTNGRELWVTDGTEVGTIMVKDINPNGSGLWFSNSRPYVYNGKLYFNASDGTNGWELWVSDGTTAGTTMLKDINLNGDSDLYGFFEFDGKLYFSANDGTHGYELWVSDGTEAGTQLFKDISPGIGSSNPSFFTAYNDKLYFRASTDPNNNYDFQLWESDGTEAGTKKIQPAVSPNSDPLGGVPYFIVLDGSLYFSANFDSNGQELWKLTTENLSIEDMGTAHIGLYPNPVKDVLHIQTEQEITTITLYSITGQRLQTLENQSKINLSAYANGMYLVQIATRDGVVTKQVVKK